MGSRTLGLAISPLEHRTPSSNRLYHFIQYFTYFPRQTDWRKWLLYKIDPGLQFSILDNGMIRVPRHEKNFCFRPGSAQAPGQFRATHLRHHDIRDQKVDGTAVLLANFQRFNSIPGTEHRTTTSSIVD